MGTTRSAVVCFCLHNITEQEHGNKPINNLFLLCSIYICYNVHTKAGTRSATALEQDAVNLFEKCLKTVKCLVTKVFTIFP